MTDWVSLLDFTRYYRSEISADDPEAQIALDSAHRLIRDECGRSFAIAPTDVGQATTRLYVPKPGDPVLRIHDCTQIISVNENSVALVAGQSWQAESKTGPRTISWSEESVPYEKLRRLQGFWYWYLGTPTIAVSALWGWPVAVPARIYEATLLAAQDFYDLRDTRFGIAGYTDAGAARVRANPGVTAAVRDYKRVESRGIA